MFNSEVKAMKVHFILVSRNLVFNFYVHVGMRGAQAVTQMSKREDN
jgi:hypothetical protein